MAISNICSFGIGIGLAFLGEYLANKKRESLTAQAIARILGAKVEDINRDFILGKLKDKTYYFHDKPLVKNDYIPLPKHKILC